MWIIESLLQQLGRQIEGISMPVLSVGFLLITGLIWTLGIIIYRLYLHPLAHVPGPLLWRITNLTRAYYAATGQYTTKLHEAHVKYGAHVRYGPDDVSIIAPEEVKIVYRGKTEFLKGPYYNAWSVNSVNLFSDREAASHAGRRGAVAHAYSTRSLLNLESFCDEASERLILLLNKNEGKQIDLAKFMSFYTFDVSGEQAFGKPFRLLELGHDQKGILDGVSNANISLAVAGCFNRWGWLVTWKPIAYLSSLILADRGPALLVNFATKLVQERLAQAQDEQLKYEQRPDMLHHFIQANSAFTGERMSFDEVLTEAISLVIAGSETTATAFCAFLSYISRHSRSLATLRQEIADTHNAGRLQFPVTYGQAAKLEYLRACMNEAYRLQPVGGMPMQRVVPPGGRELSGKYYPGGTYIGLPAYDNHRDKRAYGEDANEWRPERWMESDRGDLEQYNLAFGGGSRICLGKSIALIEMTKLLPTLVHNYDFEFSNTTQPFKQYEHQFSIAYNGMCMVRRRHVREA